MSPDSGLDDFDRALLALIQSNFPIAARPYALIASQVGTSEADAFERVSRMRKNGIIRKLGANFQSDKLGYVSTLCAAQVPPEKMPAFVAAVNALPGVTHNYEREHAYNIWFTLICPSAQKRDEILRELAKATGIAILNLPAAAMYKIRVDFPMSSD